MSLMQNYIYACLFFVGGGGEGEGRETKLIGRINTKNQCEKVNNATATPYACTLHIQSITQIIHLSSHVISARMQVHERTQ